MRAAVDELANRYFHLLAERFPVMCASDEFVSFPRAERACDLYHCLDDLDVDRIQETVADLHKLQSRFERLPTPIGNLDARIDTETLKTSLARVLFELEEAKTWRSDPLLYLKIGFIGLDHASTKPADSSEARFSRVLSRLHAIPRLLHQAEVNLCEVPSMHRAAALAMLNDCKHYLAEMSQVFSDKQEKHLDEEIHRIYRRLDELDRILRNLPEFDRPIHDPTDLLKIRLQHHFACRRTPGEVYQIAVNEWQTSLTRLDELRRQIDPSRSWQELYRDYTPFAVNPADTIGLYRNEIQSLDRYFRQRNFPGMETTTSLEIVETPRYLRSVRGSASFSVACRSQTGEKDLFYITTKPPDDSDGHLSSRLTKRFHKEYQFLTAHETIPGHHLIDSVRRSLDNPVRRQIESPLFYEGFAYYAESLLIEYGYVRSLIEQLVDAKRRLWRAARCRVDVGVNTGMIDRDQASALLLDAGFSREEANRQGERFSLNPGYQLCYTLGRYELVELRKKYEPVCGRDRFHHLVLHSGQLPFHLLDEHLDSHCSDSAPKKEE